MAVRWGSSKQKKFIQALVREAGSLESRCGLRLAPSGGSERDSNSRPLSFCFWWFLAILGSRGLVDTSLQSLPRWPQRSPLCVSIFSSSYRGTSLGMWELPLTGKHSSELITSTKTLVLKVSF